ncbi:MAG TPA: hypothetical protein VFK94_01285, partial [Patescibacteria group bacterium]|nr:hypothetical protein [Patescibacteria group bacterium]
GTFPEGLSLSDSREADDIDQIWLVGPFSTRPGVSVFNTWWSTQPRSRGFPHSPDSAQGDRSGKLDYYSR